LFVLTGASGAGKSAVCTQLARAQLEDQSSVPDCVYLEQDILWRQEFADPQNDYRGFRDTWLRVAKNVSQAGRPVVLCGSALPRQYESCLERRYFADLYYLALVCDEERLRQRLLARPAWRHSGDETFLEQMVAFNRWLRDNAQACEPSVALLDTTNQTATESARRVAGWIRGLLQSG
jgi:gluconate kinase